MADWTDKKLPANVMDSLEVNDLAVNYDISAGTVYSKNSATAWVNFDGTTTPPTIRDSFNVRDVVRTDTGRFEIYFEEDMDNINYTITGMVRDGDSSIEAWSVSETYNVHGNLNKVGITSNYDSTLHNFPMISVQIFGGTS